jgi:cell division transport system ATP-binding protein
MGHRVARGTTLGNLRIGGKPALRRMAGSLAHAQQRRRPKRPLAAIRPESRQGATRRPAGRAALFVEKQVVRFEHVGLRYGLGPEVLRDLTFRIDERSFQFLTGPSGAGKTSLLRLLFLSLRPTRGLVTLFGHDVATLRKDALAALRRRIGIVFQDFRLLDHMTTFENVALPLRVIGQAEDSYREEVVELLSWVGLGDRISALPPVLSGGEKQRAAIARAVIARPQLLLADEPTGNVDPNLAKRLLRLFVELNKSGTSVVIATHDIALMDQFDARRLVLHEGRVHVYD